MRKTFVPRLKVPPQLPIPRGYLSIEGMLPDGAGRCQFIIAKDRVDSLQRSGPSAKFYDLALVAETLGDPDATFGGLNRSGLPDSYCYSKSPTRRFQSSTIELPPIPGVVFTVSINKDHRGYVVLDWEHRKAHPEDVGHPRGWEEDFGERLWRRH